MALRLHACCTAREICRRYLNNATMEAGPTKAYNQDEATGIRLNGPRLKVAAKVHAKKK